MLVTDAELEAAIRLLIETSRQVVEGAGAAGVAGAARRRAELAGKRVGMILSGGNISLDQLRRILNGETLSPAPGGKVRIPRLITREAVTDGR
jgi:threonine dehydratase